MGVPPPNPRGFAHRGFMNETEIKETWQHTPGLPFTNHPSRRSGRSPALPYPPDEQPECNIFSTSIKQVFKLTT
jgi:hypothetical protein